MSFARTGAQCVGWVPEGITYRQLDHWVRRGYLRPQNATSGSGHSRRWPESERTVAAIMARLVNAGLTHEAAHQAARRGLAGGPIELAPGIRIVIGDRLDEVDGG